MQSALKVPVSEQDLINMLGRDIDSLDVLDDEDFEEYEDYESWRDDVTSAVYEQVRDLDGKAVDAGAFFKLQGLWERASNTRESLFFTSMTFPSGVQVGCVVDNLTKSESTHHGDPVLFLIHLV
jgi:hypothetical protein